MKEEADSKGFSYCSIMDFYEKRNIVHETHLIKEPVSKDGKAKEKKLGACFPHDPFSRALAPRQPESASCPLLQGWTIDDASA